MAQLGDDCFYFYNAGCHRGALCMYRHQPAAKNNVETCPDWLKGGCINKACVLRHAVIDNRVIPRAAANITSCKFEAASVIPHVSYPPALATTTVVTNVTKTDAPLPGNPIVLNGFPPSGLTQSILPIVQVPSQIFPGNMAVPPVQGALVPASSNIIQAQQQLPVQMLAPLQQNISVLGIPPPISTFPKNEHFTHQVRLFKEMLAGKQKSDENEVSLGKCRHKERERQKKKKNKKSKKRENHVKPPPPLKWPKESWSKEDEEILYGDYKDIKIDKKHKKRNFNNSDSESEMTSKSYEEILRERALRDMYRRRKEDKFNSEFKDLIKEKSRHTKKLENLRKHSNYESDEETPHSYASPVKSKRKKSESKKDSDEGSFSKDDALELGLDASPIREFLEGVGSPSVNEKDISDKEVEQDDSNKKESNATDAKAGSSVLETGAVLVIPDETTDINFSIEDENDELLQELNEAEKINVNNKDSSHYKSSKWYSHSKLTSSNKTSKNTSSKERVLSSKSREVEKSCKSTSTDLAKNISKSSSSDPAKNISKSPSSTDMAKSISKPKSMVSVISVSSKSSSNITPRENQSQRKKRNIEAMSSSAKHKVIKTEDNEKANAIAHQIVRSPIRISNEADSEDNDKENTKVKLTTNNEISKPSTNSYHVKVKTFEEIMVEKHKRKAQNKEILVVSDDNESRIPITTTKTVIPQKVKRSKSVEEEEKTKRQSIRLYKPPIKCSETVTLDSKTTTVMTTATTTVTKPNVSTAGVRKIISLKKSTLSALPTDIVHAASNPAAASILSSKKDGGIMSFEEIMEAKRLRKQKEEEEKQAMTAKLHEKKDSSTEKFSSNATAVTVKKSFLKRTPVIKRPSATSTSVESVCTGVITTKSNVSSAPKPTDLLSSVTTTNSSAMLYQNSFVEPSRRIESKVARVSPLRVMPSQIFNGTESLTEEQLLGDVTPTTPIQIDLNGVVSPPKDHQSREGVPRISNSPISSTAPLPNIRKMSVSSVAVPGATKLIEESGKKTSLHKTSMEDIKEALDEQKRKQKEYLLSDDEFEKEINDLCSGNDDDDDYADIDEDDLMMELQEMIDS